MKPTITNLNDEEISQIVKTSKMRIRQLEGFETPQQHIRSMYPIAVSKEELAEYTERYDSSQRRIALFKSIVSKLEA